MTLDEGLRSGDVIVTEYGNVQGLVRRRTRPSISHEGAQVNKLVLINTPAFEELPAKLSSVFACDSDGVCPLIRYPAADDIH